MMRYSSTGSAYEKDMAYVIPLLNFATKFKQYKNLHKRRLLTDECQNNVKRNVGKWGIVKTFIEYGNMYRLHVPKSSDHWTVQQTMSVKYNDKSGKWLYHVIIYMIQTTPTGQQGTLNGTIVR